MIADRHCQMARFGALFLVLFALAGCGKEPPGCADEKTLALVKEAYWDTVAKNAVNLDEKSLLALVKPKFNVVIEVPRIAEKRADAGKVFCAATLKVALSEESGRSVDNLFKRESAANVEYSTQLTADNAAHVVELAGHDSAVEYVWSLAKMGAFSASQGATVAAQPTPEASSPATPAEAKSVAPASVNPPNSGAARSDSASAASTSESAQADFAAADKALNDAYQATRASLSDAQRLALRDQQRVWVKQRDEQCSEAELSGATGGAVTGGSALAMEVVGCKTTLTKKRTLELLRK